MASFLQAIPQQECRPRADTRNGPYASQHLGGGQLLTADAGISGGSPPSAYRPMSYAVAVTMRNRRGYRSFPSEGHLVEHGNSAPVIGAHSLTIASLHDGCPGDGMIRKVAALSRGDQHEKRRNYLSTCRTNQTRGRAANSARFAPTLDKPLEAIALERASGPPTCRSPCFLRRLHSDLHTSAPMGWPISRVPGH